MSESQNTTDTGESPDSPDQVLAARHAHHQLATQIEIGQLKLADLGPPRPSTYAARWPPERSPAASSPST